MCKRSDSGKGVGLPFPSPSTGSRRPNSRKLLWRLLGKLAGKLSALGGVPGELLRRVPILHWIGFWQNGFFVDLGSHILTRILSPDCFSSFLWVKVPKKSSKKVPDKICQNLYNKNLQHISAEGPGQKGKGNLRSSFPGNSLLAQPFSGIGAPGPC